ncbi:autotransporter-associated beta strand repeat-containing protein, partial [Ralstonia pseudosolanacearum]|uniref:autotransporter-associated beta strand repeat-containing protein n=1 Tax=Ralstonia pseudosolanacearum TaxID=1310165 RepID=UPI003D276926
VDGVRIANKIELTGSNDPIIDTGAFTGTLAGAISGTGFLTKAGSGTLLTTGANTYSGATIVAQGQLKAGAVNTLSPASVITVNQGATLDLAGHSQRIAGMNLAGVVSLPGASPGASLTVTGPWVGNGGVLRVGTVNLAASQADTDRVILDGANAVASGSTYVQIDKITGLGQPTSGQGVALFTAMNGASIQDQA